jgi:hypothetical protein
MFGAVAAVSHQEVPGQRENCGAAIAVTGPDENHDYVGAVASEVTESLCVRQMVSGIRAHEKEDIEIVPARRRDRDVHVGLSRIGLIVRCLDRNRHGWAVDSDSIDVPPSGRGE